MKRWQKIGAWVMVALVVGGHVALWMSDRMPAEEKLRLTLMNAAIWAVVLLPAFGVAKWAEQHKARPRDRK